MSIKNIKKIIGFTLAILALTGLTYVMDSKEHNLVGLPMHLLAAVVIIILLFVFLGFILLLMWLFNALDIDEIKDMFL